MAAFDSRRCRDWGRQATRRPQRRRARALDEPILAHKLEPRAQAPASRRSQVVQCDACLLLMQGWVGSWLLVVEKLSVCSFGLRWRADISFRTQDGVCGVCGGGIVVRTERRSYSRQRAHALTSSVSMCWLSWYIYIHENMYRPPHHTATTVVCVILRSSSISDDGQLALALPVRPSALAPLAAARGFFVTPLDLEPRARG